MNRIPYGRQDVTDADIEAVVAVLRSDFLTQGPTVPAFERAVGAYCGAAHAVAFNSATSALHVACLSLGLGPGDWLWTSPISFVASANCALYCGARVDFVDIDPRTYNLCPDALARKLVQAEREGVLPKIVVPVHLAGQSCDMEAIHRLAKRYGFRVVEDASHAIGGSYRNRPVGGCDYSDITVFSFHPVKIITSAEGGMAVTNDEESARRMAILRSHGITRDPARMTRAPDGPWYYQQVDLGFNYRMTDVQAALGLSQLKRIDTYVQARHRLARRYEALLSDMPLTLPHADPVSHSALHLYIVRLLAGEPLRRRVYERMLAQGIGVNVHYIPIHTQPYFAQFGYRAEDFPNADSYYEAALSLPMYPTLADDEQDRVVRALADALVP